MTHAKHAFLVLGLLLGAALIGCDMPPTAEEWVWPDAAISDTDEDGDDGPTGPEECPWNSGYPCTCDKVGEECDDQSKCLYVTGDGELGICSAVCFEPHTDCVKTGFGGESSCVLDGGGASFRCALVCEDDDQCPPDQSCVDMGWAVLCHP
jgi:hypothetical protein